MVKPADTSCRDAKEEWGRECSHLPFQGWRGVAATEPAKRRRVEMSANFIVTGLQLDNLSKVESVCVVGGKESKRRA